MINENMIPWKMIEETLPGIKEAFELCIMNFIMCGHATANIDVIIYEHPYDQKIHKYSINMDYNHEVIRLYYSTIVKEIELVYFDSVSKTTSNYKSQIHIKNIEQLKEILLKVNLEN